MFFLYIWDKKNAIDRQKKTDCTVLSMVAADDRLRAGFIFPKIN